MYFVDNKSDVMGSMLSASCFFFFFFLETFTAEVFLLTTWDHVSHLPSFVVCGDYLDVSDLVSLFFLCPVSFIRV